MTASKTVFAVSDHAQRMPRRASLSRDPAVSEAGVVFDVVETWIAIAELLADTLDEGSYIGTIALCTVSGDEVFPVDAIINLAVADVLRRGLGEECDNPRFRSGPWGGLSGHEPPFLIKGIRQRAELERCRSLRTRIGRRPKAVCD